MPAGNKDKCKIYQDAKNEWRWRRTAANNEIVGASTEGYKNKGDCIANAEQNMVPCPIIEEGSI